MNTLTAQSTKFGNFVLLRCRPVGGPGSREPFGVPVSLGTWEPDIIGILSSYGAKAVSKVISHLRCKISLKLMMKTGQYLNKI